MARLLEILLTAAAVGAAVPASDAPSGQVRALPDQAQVRILGRVTSVRAEGRTVGVEADGMRFAAEIEPGLRVPVAHVGDRVLVTGLLQPRGRVLLQTMEVVSSVPAADAVVGMLLSVSLPQRRLVLRSDAGRRLRVAIVPTQPSCASVERAAPRS